MGRLRIVLLAALAAALAAASANSAIRPVRPADAKLLQRSASYEEQVAEYVAARLTRLRPSVRCGPLGIAAPPGLFISGVTLFPPQGGHADYFLIEPSTCGYLTAFREDPASFDPATCADAACMQEEARAAFALATVSHESYHVLGYHNEAQVECYGMQSIWFVAKTLGASIAEGQRIASSYWKTTYAQRRTSTPTYWTPQCRNGGKYDLRPKSSSWPS
jgi:hypothetical protein